jgi:hypothetical protein
MRWPKKTLTLLIPFLANCGSTHFEGKGSQSADKKDAQAIGQENVIREEADAEVFTDLDYGRVLKAGGRIPANHLDRFAIDVGVKGKFGNTELYYAPCDPKTQGGHFNTSHKATIGPTVQVVSEFCPEIQEAKERIVMFIVDFSGSMIAEHGDISQPLPPSDPSIQNSCGRLRAAEALITKIQQAQSVVSYRIALVGFGTFAQLKVPLVSIEQFTNYLNHDTFCGAYVDGLTNYQEAFDVAHKALQNQKSPVSAFFISDGRPTKYSNSLFGIDDPIVAKEKGREAAHDMRAEIADFTLKGILLGQDPQANELLGYLAQLTGDSKSVRQAENADDLVTQIIGLGLPGALMRERTATARQKYLNGERPVDLETFSEHPSKNRVWTYMTKPFELMGQRGLTVANSILVTARRIDNQVLESKFVIDYTLRP